MLNSQGQPEPLLRLNELAALALLLHELLEFLTHRTTRQPERQRHRGVARLIPLLESGQGRRILWGVGSVVFLFKVNQKMGCLEKDTHIFASGTVLSLRDRHDLIPLRVHDKDLRLSEG